jgi:hypothetical protein
VNEDIINRKNYYHLRKKETESILFFIVTIACLLVKIRLGGFAIFQWATGIHLYLRGRLKGTENIATGQKQKLGSNTTPKIGQ